ncbi:MAG: glycosyltransferase [Planctomycetaceae bacterium]|jgi:glycosyltransferase involved in cell wall biosynthesis|nr:glycosyltransferase [Planctomycetaceae bacterium]
MSAPKVSIIVPVWNVEKYLHRSLGSLCGQTLREIEIITINDSSPDNSLSIQRDYAAKDNRVKVITFTENRGVSAARNAGLDVAEGEYLGFVDPDDAVEPKFYETLYRKAKDRGADIVNGNRKQFDYDGNEIIGVPNYHVRFWEAQILGTFWTGIYRTSLIRNNNIRFPEDLTMAEDLVFLYHAMFKANKILSSDFVYYHYYRRPDSAYTENSGLNQMQIEAGMKTLALVAANFTQAYLDNVISGNIYDNFTYKFLAKSIMFATGTDDTILKHKCVKAVFNIYEQCVRKEYLLDRLYGDNYNTYLSLKANDEKSLTRFLVENASIDDIAASDDALPTVYLER